MLRISKLSSIFRGKKLILTSSLIFVGLLAATAYDLFFIIDTYLNDNRMTVVRTKDIGENDSIPFLDNLKIKMDYDVGILFPSLANASKWYDYFKVLMKEEILNGTLYTENLNFSTMEDRMKMLALIDSVRLLNTAGLRATYMNDSVHDDGNRGAYGFLTDILRRNSSSIDKLEKQVWNYFRLYLIGNTDEKISLDEYFDVNSLGPLYMLGNILTSRILKGTKARSQILLGPVETEKTDTKNAAYGFTLHIYKTPTSSETIIIPTDKVCDIELLIDNIGVYNTQAITPKCATEQDTTHVYGTNIVDREVFFKTFIKKCGCLPFSDRTEYRAFMASDESNPPFCDIEAYLRCSDMKMKFDERQVLPPCVKWKNQYQIISNCFNNTPKGHAKFSLQIVNSFYAIYEERYQMTPTQFVSQLGGDIGLYTGISVLTLWQLIVYLYNKYTKFKAAHRERREESSINDPTGGNISVDFFKAFVISVFKHIEETMITVSRRKSTKIDEEISQRVDRKMEKFSDDLDRWQSKMEGRQNEMMMMMERMMNREPVQDQVEGSRKKGDTWVQEL